MQKNFGGSKLVKQKTTSNTCKAMIYFIAFFVLSIINHKKNNIMKTSIKFCEYSQTFRLMPFNYWIASVDNNRLVFDSWDGMTKKHFKKDRLLKLKVWFKFSVKTLKTILK